jgi:hypothetical protein
MIVNAMKQAILFSLFLLLPLVANAQAEPVATIPAAGIKAMTMDGRQVLLKSDNTWEFVSLAQGDPSVSAVLSVTRIWDMEEACKLQFRLQNNLGYRISNLVPRMSVQNQAGVVYDSKSISFASLNPTTEKYTEVQFAGIGCKDIAHVKVYDAARCNMGDIDQWNEEEGECLSHLYVEPSSLINISK